MPMKFENSCLASVVPWIVLASVKFARLSVLGFLASINRGLLNRNVSTAVEISESEEDP